MSFEWVVQKAVYDRLLSNAELIALGVPVYDDVPQPKDKGAAVNFPYLMVGDDSVAAWDTDTELGCEFEITIHTWSRYEGRKETKQLQGIIYSAMLDTEFSIESYSVATCHFTGSDSFVDADGKTRHGVSKFTMLIEQL